nr:zinc finger, CCHC-type, retrotransposon Gag domain protein [Tanacetum cinerariifolium]
MLVEIPHQLLFTHGLNALTSRSLIPLRRRQLPLMRRIGSLTWRRSLMLWVVKMLLRQDWLFISLKERLKRVYHFIRQTSTETSTEFMQRFLRLAGFLGAAAGTEEEQAKNFQWGLRRSTLNHLMCMSYTDVAQVSNAARNYEILHERDDDGTERPDKQAAAGTEEEQAKNFQWGLRRSTLNHLMCMSYTDVAQVANAARNYEILHERDEEDTERPDK